MLWEKVNKKIVEKGWIIYKLALTASVVPATIYRLRDGKVNDLYFEMVKKIADALDVSLYEFR